MHSVSSMRFLWHSALVLCMFLFFCIPHTVGASATGWFHLIGDTRGEDVSCGPGMARVEVALMIHGSSIPIDPVGTTVRVRIVDKTTKETVSDTGIQNARAVSDSLCFNPATHAVLPTVTGGTQYYPAGGVALSFKDVFTQVAVAGNHIRGHVHLLPRVSSEPNASHAYPPDGAMLMTRAPEFRVFTHMITPAYGASVVNQTTLYVRNVQNGTIQATRIYPTYGTNGEFTLTPVIPDLADGFYQWFFHQKIDGISNVYVSNTPFAFTGFPESSLSEVRTFRVDTVAPTIAVVIDNKVRSADDTSETVRVSVTLNDSGSRLDRARVEVYEQGGPRVANAEVLFLHTSPGPYSSRTVNLNDVTMEGGKTYEVRVTAHDIAGNVRNATQLYTVVLGPILGNVSHELRGVGVVELRAELLRTGTLPVLSRQLCWGTLPSALTNCENFSGDVGVFAHVFSGIPLTDIYYRAYAITADGVTMSELRDFSLSFSSSQIMTCVGTDAQAHLAYAVPGVTEYAVSYCTGELPCDESARTPLTPPGTACATTHTTCVHSNLTYNTRYRYYLRLNNEGGSGVWGAWNEFYNGVSLDCTPPTPAVPIVMNPTIGTHEYVSPTERNVRLGATVVSQGSSALEERGTCWALNRNDLLAYMTFSASPIASYDFNEGSGTTLTDRSGTNTGTLNAGVTWTTSGKNGGAARFNGTNGYITVSDAPSLDLTSGMTLEAWVYPAPQGGWRTAILKETANDLSYALYASNNSGVPSAYVGGNGTNAVSALPANTWSHIASTFDGATQTLYVNGALVSSGWAEGIIPSMGVLRFGGNNVWGEYFVGVMDDVRIYNRALSQAHIQRDMETPVGGTLTSTTPPECLPEGGTGVTSFTHVRTLPEGSEVFFAGYARNAEGGVGYSAVRTMIVGAVAPTLGALTYTNVLPGSARLGASIESDGGAPLDRVQIAHCVTSSASCTPTNWYSVTPIPSSIPTTFETVRTWIPVTEPRTVFFRVRVRNTNQLQTTSVLSSFQVEPFAAGAEGEGQSTYLPQ